MTAQRAFVSVFVPTLNGGRLLTEVIDAVLGQRLPPGHALDLIVIDSGSTDDTIGTLRAYGDRLRLEIIPNAEFGHGRTRQRAAEMARGEFVLFLTQDATPAHDGWLMALIEPFGAHAEVGCVVGAQIPRSGSPATIRREVTGVFERLHDADPRTGRFLSNVNSAVRRDLLMGEVPLRDVAYAEDQALAADMRQAGYAIAYAPEGRVLHSHDLTPLGYFARKLDEHVGLQQSVGVGTPASVRRLLLGWIRPTLHDIGFAARDRSNGARGALRDVLTAPLYNLALEASRYLAARHRDEPQRLRRLSLEARARTRTRTSDQD